MTREQIEELRAAAWALPPWTQDIKSVCDLALKGLQVQEAKRAESLPKEDFKLSQANNILLRLLRARDAGLLTADLFAGLHVAKYTSRISDLRKKGFIIEAQPEKVLAGGLETSQWRYRLKGYGYISKEWPKVVAEAIEQWSKVRLQQPSFL